MSEEKEYFEKIIEKHEKMWNTLKEYINNSKKNDTFVMGDFIYTKDLLKKMQELEKEESVNE